MPELYSDDNGNRVIVRHRGPAGKGFPSGGTTGQILVKTSDVDFDAEWDNAPTAVTGVQGPSSAVNNNVAVFNGVTGRLLKDGGVPLSSFASALTVATKVDKVTGKGLSTEDYTTTEKTRLARSWNGAGYRGSFASLSVINATVFSPLPTAGDYCLIEVAAEDVQEVLWDATNSVWFVQSTSAVSMTGAEIAAVLFDSGDVWDLDTCRIFTETEKGQLANHEAVINSLGSLVTTIPYGAISYFNLIGTAMVVTSASLDAITNMVKVDVPTTVLGISVLFDNGGGTPPPNARLRYTGSAERKFYVNARLSYTGDVDDALVLGIFKNGALDLSSRALSSVPNPANIATVAASAIISLSLNDYLELFIGNINLDNDFHVYSLTLEVIPL